MSGQSILAILNRVETAASVLAAAASVSRVYRDAPVDVLYPRPDVDPGFMPTEEIMLPDRRAAFEAAQDALSAQLLHIARDAAVPHASSRVLRGTVRKQVAEAASNALLVIVGAAGQGRRALAQDAIEAVLFDARAPLLLLPGQLTGLPGRAIAVAWERGQAAEEAIEAALPLLLAADRVEILIAAEGHPRADLPGGLVEALRRAGPGATLRRFDIGGRDIGTAILDEATTMDADLLVMGAFTHPRMLEALFGGATRAVLAGARIPLLLHH